MTEPTEHPFTTLFAKLFTALNLKRDDLSHLSIGTSYVTAILKYGWVLNDDQIKRVVDDFQLKAAKLPVNLRPNVPAIEEWLSAAAAQPHDRRPARDRFGKKKDKIESPRKQIQNSENDPSGAKLTYFEDGTIVVPTPWLQQESILRKYRKVLHQCHQTSLDGEVFWIYKKLDFSRFMPGVLFCQTSIRIEKETFHYEIYGYIRGDSLLLVTNTDKSKASHKEFGGICHYYDFCKAGRGDRGHFGFIESEDYEGSFGIGACLISPKPFRGVKVQGRQSAAIGTSLYRRWKVEKARCNRILIAIDLDPV